MQCKVTQLLFACWVIHRLLIFIFFKTNIKNLFIDTIGVTNGFDPDQDRRSVSPDLGPNWLEMKRVSADDKFDASKEIGGLLCKIERVSIL